MQVKTGGFLIVHLFFIGLNSVQNKPIESLATKKLTKIVKAFVV